MVSGYAIVRTGVDLRLVHTAASIIESYNGFVERIEALDLTDAADAKPILDVCC